MRLVIVPMAVVALTQTVALGGPRGDTWVLLMGENVTMSGSMGDVKRARAQRRGKEDLLYVRRGSAAFVVRDPTLVARAVGIFAPLAAPEQRMEGYDRVQQILSQRMEELEKRLEGGEGHEHLAAQMEALGQQIERIGREQERIGRELEKLSDEAEKRMIGLVDEAIRSGRAVPAIP